MPRDASLVEMTKATRRAKTLKIAPKMRWTSDLFKEQDFEI